MLLFAMIYEEKDIPGTYGSIDLDEALLKSIADGDSAAFETLYLQTERTLYAYLLSLLRSHHDALDVLHDTYLKIRSAAHLYKPMGKPMAWLFTIAKNLALSYHRKRQREQTDIAELENNMEFAYVTDSTDRLVLMRALQILSEQERSIILLHAVSGMKHSEIAGDLGLPLSTVLSKYHRGLKKLRNHLTGEEV